MNVSKQIAAAAEPLQQLAKAFPKALGAQGITQVWFLRATSCVDVLEANESVILAVGCSLQEVESFVENRDARARKEFSDGSVVFASGKSDRSAELEFQDFESGHWESCFGVDYIVCRPLQGMSMGECKELLCYVLGLD